MSDEKKKLMPPSPTTNSSGGSFPFLQKWNVGKKIMKGFKKVQKTIGMAEEEEVEHEPTRINEKEIKYLALEELNYYMINLGLKWDVASEIIIDLSMK